MVLTEVYLPSIDKYFDFQLDEKMRVQEAAVEILNIVSNSENINTVSNANDAVICLMDKRTVLPGMMRLMDCGIKTGSRLMVL